MNNKVTKKKLSKTTIIAIVIVAVLVVAFAIFLPLYISHNKDNQALYHDQKIAFYDGDTLLGEYDYDHLCTLATYEEFNAIYDTSTTDAQHKTYSGVELINILEAMKIDLEGKTCVRFSASDGASNVYSIDDLRKENNVFIADKVNGKSFVQGIDPTLNKAKYEDGGPYVVIRASDRFSQYRIKLLVKVEVI
ncbi:MAG: hypothetical protein WCR54_02500 [Clostridia bacterium]